MTDPWEVTHSFTRRPPFYRNFFLQAYEFLMVIKCTYITTNHLFVLFVCFRMTPTSSLLVTVSVVAFLISGILYSALAFSHLLTQEGKEERMKPIQTHNSRILFCPTDIHTALYSSPAGHKTFLLAFFYSALKHG